MYITLHKCSTTHDEFCPSCLLYIYFHVDKCISTLYLLEAQFYTIYKNYCLLYLTNFVSYLCYFHLMKKLGYFVICIFMIAIMYNSQVWRENNERKYTKTRVEFCLVSGEIL